MSGSFVLVLHTHLPWLKRAGEWPVGEEWLFQAWGEAYLPVLDVLDRQAALGRREVLTLGLTPLILHQMQDRGLLDRFHAWLGQGMLRAQMLADNAGQWPDSDARRAAGANWYTHSRTLLDMFEARGCELVPSFRRLAQNGTVEVLGGPVTHAYLPLHDDDTVRAQLRLGLDAGEAALGVRPEGLWLPECAYSPGLETILAGCGVRHVVLDGPTLIATGVPDVLRHAWEIGDSGVCVLGRDLEVAYRVWSPTGGYPGHGVYREYHRWEWETGLKCWRVTDKTVPQADKSWYDPSLVPAVVREQVADFAALARDSVTSSGDVVVACYDTELFGHWWLEGPDWLGALLDTLADDPVAAPTTFAAYLRTVGPAGNIRPPAGSWGLGKDFSIWDNPSTSTMWERLDETNRRLRKALRARLGGDAGSSLLVQAARELFLAQSSDWAFMIGHDKSVEFARERFDVHAGAAERCLDEFEADPAAEPGWLGRLASDDDILPRLTVAALREAYSA